MDRSTLLAHLRKTHFAPGDRDQALADALAIARFLRSAYDVRVIGVGSLFERDRPFRERSDIDLVVRGLDAERFYEASAKAAAMTDFELDIVPFEDANDYMREIAETRGVEL